MRRRRLGVGAELAPLLLILACLAGSFGLIVAAYRRVTVTRNAPQKPVVVAVAPTPVLAPPVPKSSPPPLRVPPKAAVAKVPPPVPEDPTPKALAALASAEAEQLLEASRANRKALALEVARQAAVSESERWRRRQSLIHSQINTLESKVRKAETSLDVMALERDALEKELDAKKAAVARAKTRPSQAILPHKGPNGTWRRPIVVECRNGAAVIQPQGIEFGLYDLESGFGASSNPFVAAVAREAIRVQRQASPDGSLVIPYIFFVVRPDGIRPYYEARGRLEPLGITFGYELADAEWDIEFPNLDDTTTWDGSAPSGASDRLSRTGPGSGKGSSAEDTDLPSWPGASSGAGSPGRVGDPSSPFTFGGNGGNARSGSIMGRAFDGPATPPADSPFTGLQGAAMGGDAANTGASAVGSTRNLAEAGPAPAGFPASFLPGGDRARDRSEGLAEPAGTAPKLASLGGNPPSAPGGVTASGRVVPAGSVSGTGTRTETGNASGSPGDPQGKPGSGADRFLATAGQGGVSVPRPALDFGLDASGPKPGGSAARNRSQSGTEAPPIELALDGPDADSPAGSPVVPSSKPRGRGGLPGGSDPSTPPPLSDPTDLAQNGPTDDLTAGSSPSAETKPDEADPASKFVWPGGPNGDGKKRAPSGPPPADESLILPGSNADCDAESQSQTQAAVGADPSQPATNGGGSAQPSGSSVGAGGNQAARQMLGPPQPGGQAASSASSATPPAGPTGIGLNAPAMPPSMPMPSPSSLPNIPPPATIPPVPMNLPIPRHLPTPTEAAAAVQRQTSAAPNLADWVPPGSTVDKTFEVVVVCGPKGVIVQPGNYRVTAEALKDHDGLFKKQVVALVKNRRLADPKTQVEPRIRFLIQPRGFETYRTAKSQFFLSGLNWPASTQVADPDPLVIQSRGVW